MNPDIPQLLIYQDYSFTRNSSQLKSSGDANPKDIISYRCSKADTTDCKAFLHVNLASDVLSAFIEHNHTPKSKEGIDTDFFMDSKPKALKSRCTKRQVNYLIDYMLKNQDLATGPKDNRVESRNALKNKWQTLAFNLAEIGHPKSVKHLKATWKDLKKGARAEIASLMGQRRGRGKLVPSEKTCKVFAALGKSIDAKNLGYKELADLRKTASASERPNIFKNTAASDSEQAMAYEEEESTDMSSRSCTKAQMTCLVNYMQQNKDFAISDPRDPSFLKKWRELESKLAKIGPWKSISHLKGTWKELKKHSRKMSQVLANEERPSPNTLKVINIMGLPLVFLEPEEAAEGHDFNKQPTETPKSTATDEESSRDNDDENVNDDDDDRWPIFQVDSYP